MVDFIEFLLILLLLYFVFGFVFFIMNIVGFWKMFTKAGRSGWESLIPIYNLFVLCTIVGISPYWLLTVFLSFFANILPVIGTIFFYVIILYFSVLLSVSTARAYGKSDSFAIGLLIIPHIFRFVLGIGSSEYMGACPMNDPIGDFIFGLLGISNTTSTASTYSNVNGFETNNSNGYSYTYSNHDNGSSNNQNTVNAEVLQEADNKFCKKCGVKLEHDDQFCVSCGTKVDY